MELLERFTGGDLDAFETLFRQFQGEVYGWILRVVRDPGVAEDLTVEAFWRIYRGRARFDPSRNFGAWARRIATNLALDHLKTRRPEIQMPENANLASSANTGMQSEIHDGIARAFRQLPARLQLAATLALIEQKPYEEIAAALEVSVSAVKSRVFRAVRLLRKKLRRLGIEP